jgi:hypothetical protein
MVQSEEGWPVPVKSGTGLLARQRCDRKLIANYNLALAKFAFCDFAVFNYVL